MIFTIDLRSMKILPYVILVCEKCYSTTEVQAFKYLYRKLFGPQLTCWHCGAS